MHYIKLYKKYYDMIRAYVPIEYDEEFLHATVLNRDIDIGNDRFGVRYHVSGFTAAKELGSYIDLLIPTVFIGTNNAKKLRLSILESIDFNDMAELDEFITSGKLASMYSAAMEYYHKVMTLNVNFKTELDLLRL